MPILSNIDLQLIKTSFLLNVDVQTFTLSLLYIHDLVLGHWYNDLFDI